MTRARSGRTDFDRAAHQVEVSGRILRRLSPDTVALAGLAAYLAIAAIAPVAPTVDANWTAILYVIACYAAFLIGVALCKLKRPTVYLPRLMRIEALSRRSFYLVMAVATVGVALRVTDRFIVRNVVIGDDFTSIRQQLEATDSSLLSAVGAALYPAAYFGLIAFYLLPRDRRFWLAGVAACLLFLYPSFEAGIQGSRSLMLVSAGFILLARELLVHAFGVLRRPLVFYGAAILMIYGFFVIFEMRLDEAGKDFLQSAEVSGYAFTVPPDKATEQFILESSSFAKAAASITLHISQYYCHSGYELMYVFDRLPETHLYGAYNLFHLIKLVGLVTGDPAIAESVKSVDLRTGVFATFFVPLFVDFGWLGIFVMAGFGYGCCSLWLAMCRRPTVWFPLYAYMAIVIFLMPVTSFIVAAQGLYTICALSLLGLALSAIEREPGSEPDLAQPGSGISAITAR